ncbi:MAG: TasA family protein [Nocardioidaceae bacterium]|nr:TasA family protein [Nocardioidaceae bacterium]
MSSTEERAGNRAARTSWWRRLTGDKVKALLSLGVVLGVGAVGTMAAWTDNATATSTFSTGNVQIRLTDNNVQAYGFTTLSMTNMAPGYSKASVLKVKNTGSLDFGYTISAAATDSGNVAGLGAGLRVKITADTTVSGSGNAITCSGTALTGANGVAPAAVNAAARNLVGTTGNETLCFQVSLPTDASTQLQSASTSIVFTFTATNL